MAEVDVVLWAHRKHPIQGTCRESVLRLTSGDYAYHEMIEPGTCHQNMNRAYHTGSARFVCLLDEDVEILNQDWVWHLVKAMRADESIGVLNTLEVKTADERRTWIDSCGLSPLTSLIRTIPWAPAYVTLYDRERTPWLVFDERIPGRKGMSDLDASLQITKGHGLRCRRHMGIAVYHPHKPDEQGRLALGTTTKQEELDCFPAQRQYMVEKWGPAYLEVIKAAAVMSLAPGDRPAYYNPSWFREAETS